jgi:hypothetical protein
LFLGGSLTRGTFPSLPEKLRVADQLSLNFAVIDIGGMALYLRNAD